MSDVLKRKLAKKVVLLALLTATLAYLRAPAPVQAVSCVELCHIEEQECINACHGNAACEQRCEIDFVTCAGRCGPS
jgi:hypothetical protein